MLTPPEGHQVDLIAVGVICALWGGHIALRILQDPQALSRGDHPAWRRMFYLMLFLLVGLMLAYVPYDFYIELIP